MDGASSAATVLQLIQTTSQVISALTWYANSVKNADSSCQQLLEYITLIQGAAAAVNAILERPSANSNHHAHVKDWFRDDGPPAKCQKVLDKLRGSLDKKAKKGFNLLGKIRWPFTENNIEAAVRGVEKYIPYFQLVLEIDTSCTARDLRDTQEHMKDDVQVVAQRVEDVGQTVNTLADNIAAERHQLKTEQIDADQEAHMKSILDWLKGYDCTVKHENTRKLRQNETCEWLFKVLPFVEWRASMIRFVWLHGIAGSGKSVLASAVIDEAADGLLEGQIIVYFYCDFRSPRTTRAMEVLRSLLVQLLRNARINWMPMFSDLVARKDRGAQPPEDVTILTNLVRTAMGLYERPIIVIDALDECKDQQELLSALTTLNEGNAQLFCVSRPEVIIKEAFAALPSISLTVMEEALLDDMRRHIMIELACRRMLKTLGTNQKEKILRLLLEKAQGMFRWVQCQLDRLDTCRSTGDIDHTLRTLPSGLFETYDRILQNIEEREFDGEVVRRVLLWLVVARKPLTLSALWEGLKIDLTSSVLNDKIALIHEEVILEICGSLVSFDEQRQSVTLAHYTVQEYLTDVRSMSDVHTKYMVTLPGAHLQMAKLCMHYVIVFVEQFDFVRIQRDYPFLDYAVLYGPSHITDIPEEDDSIIPFLIAYDEHLSANPCKWWAIYKRHTGYRHNVPSTFRMIIEHGPIWLLQRYLDQFPVQSVDRNSSLIWAAGFGKVGHAKVFLDHGVDVNAEGEDHWGRIALPLEMAVGQRDKELVKLFLERGSRVPGIDAPCTLVPFSVIPRLKHDYTLLHASFEWPIDEGDHVEIMKILVEAGCVPESLPCRGGTLLILAATRGHFNVAEWLLDRGCQLPVDFLSAAIQHSWYMPSSLIAWSLQHEATTNPQEKLSGDNALHALMRRPFRLSKAVDVIEAAKSLIDVGCDVNVRNVAGQTPLDVAVENQATSIVEYLINRGARVHGNVVHALANIHTVANFKPTLRALIQAGLDIKEASASVDSAGNTILHALCLSRAQSIQQLFSPFRPGERWSDCDDKINDPHAYDSLSERPLLQRFNLFQEAEFDIASLVDIKNSHGFTALRIALDFELPSPQVISYLMDLGETFENVNHLPLDNISWAAHLPWYADAVAACLRATTSQSMTPRDVCEVRLILSNRLNSPRCESRRVVDRIMEIAEIWACTSVTHHGVKFERDTTQELSTPEFPSDIQNPVVQRIVFSYAGKYHEGRPVERWTSISRSVRRNGITHEPFSDELRLKTFSTDRGFYWIYHTTTDVFWDRRHASGNGSSTLELAPGDALILSRSAPENVSDWSRLEAKLELEFYRIDIYYSVS